MIVAVVFPTVRLDCIDFIEKNYAYEMYFEVIFHFEVFLIFFCSV